MAPVSEKCMNQPMMLTGYNRIIARMVRDGARNPFEVNAQP